MSVIKTLLMEDDEWEPVERKQKRVKLLPPCSSCGSTTIKEILDYTPSLNYSRLYCGACGAFLQQGQDPAITKASDERDSQILIILNNFELPHHEESFLNDQLYKRYATPKQRAWMDNISMRVLEKKFDWSAYEG